MLKLPRGTVPVRSRLRHQPLLVDALHVAATVSARMGGRAIDPDADLHRLARQHIAPKPGRNLHGQRRLAAAHTPVESA